MIQVLRAPWEAGFPEVIIHTTESSVKKHATYQAAKAGNSEAALELVFASLGDNAIEALVTLGLEDRPTLISVHAEEAIGINAIPEVFADVLSVMLSWQIEDLVIQANVVNHTGAGGFERLARQAVFEGVIESGRKYLIVDDFVGQGGTIANLRGHIIDQGGIVVGATVLTGKPHSAILALDRIRLETLRGQHGRLETWWEERFGFGFQCLTASEARYLINTQDSETIRSRIQEADAAAA